jgi:hypothetical protein
LSDYGIPYDDPQNWSEDEADEALRGNPDLNEYDAIRSTVMVLMEDLKNSLSLEREVSGKNPFSEDFPQKGFI